MVLRADPRFPGGYSRGDQARERCRPAHARTHRRRIGRARLLDGLDADSALQRVLHVFPPGGYVPFATDPRDNLLHLAMPAATLGVFLGATLLRFLRGDMLEALGSDYVRTARSKGLAQKRLSSATRCATR